MLLAARQLRGLRYTESAMPTGRAMIGEVT